MSKVSPCLWFDGQAEEAANFYVDTFRACGQDAAIGKISYYGASEPGSKGKVLMATFSLAGHDFLALNGGPQYAFSPAISLMVSCEDQPEVDAFWERLTTERQTRTMRLADRPVRRLLAGRAEGAGRDHGKRRSRRRQSRHAGPDGHDEARHRRPRGRGPGLNPVATLVQDSSRWN